MDNCPELGYQYLNTSFSGTSSSALSGNDYFLFIPSDFGVAGTLEQKEFHSS